ncbi:MAG: DNA-protecting protein DprA [Clostridiales bacterium]|jgi:DNA processing protein|nr:DNA-protecting protein DprA [Clostridiales bacterium]
MKDLIILALLQIPQIGKKTIEVLFKNNTIVPNSISEVRELFLDTRYINAAIKVPEVIEIEKALNKAESIIETSIKENIKLVSILHDDFPKKLKNIPNPPVLLYYKGNFNCLIEENSIAVIGTREPTKHGAKIAKRIGYIFGEKNFIVVSGLAIGCDMYAHTGCVDAKGKSVAVLPCGLDNVYPKSNRQLAEEILNENGCLVSEYAVGTKPYKNLFIERDRLQSGLSKAVFVVETDIKGGTMHTVRFSQEQKRILACFSHPEEYLNEEKTKGNQKLIKEGKAIAVKDEKDIKTLIEKILEFKYLDTFEENNESNNYKQLSFY